MSASDILRMFDEVGFESVRLLTSVLWQSSVLLGGVAILSWMLRRRGASARRALWVSGVLAVPVLPLLVYLGTLAGAPQAPLEIMPAYWPPQVSTVAAGEEGPESPLALQTVSTAQVREAGHRSYYPWALAFGVYLAGAGCFLFFIVRARMCIRRLIRNGIPTTDPRVQEAFRGAARGLGLRGHCRVLESDEAGAPVVVGVGIGGTAEKTLLLAKKALLRKIGEPNPEAEVAELEREILQKVNNLGIGPAGYGGRVTALAVHVEVFPSHIASMPVAVNLQCHSARHKEAIL